MRRFVQGMIAAILLAVSMPAHAAMWYATFWGDTVATFAFDSDAGFYGSPELFNSEDTESAAFPGHFVHGSDIGNVQLDTRSGQNFLSIYVDDNNSGDSASSFLSTSTDIFTPGDPFGKTIDYTLASGDTAAAIYYPLGSFGVGSPVTGITRFTFSTVAPVPEPATWAMMILGFGAIGIALRRRSRPRGQPVFSA